MKRKRKERLVKEADTLEPSKFNLFKDPPKIMPYMYV